MSERVHPCGYLFASILVLLTAVVAHAQPSYAPPNEEAPNPFRAGVRFGQLPDGRHWGSTAGVAIAPDGSIWAYDRCGANGCADSALAPIVHFDAAGGFINAFGAGLFVFPHGLWVDDAGNVWVTDAQGDDAQHKGHQVYKFSPRGEVLLTLGRAGVSGTGLDTFDAPAAVAVAENGDIFVAEGHSPLYGNSRIMKFSPNGEFLKTWGHKGTAPGEFMGPHCLAFDSQGRLFVGDRSNNRIQIFDQEGGFIAEWKQFGRPSGMYIDADDTLYVADSESTDVFRTEPPERRGYGYNPGVKRGIRIGSAKDGIVVAFIPDPDPKDGSSGAEGVAVGRDGSVYGAEVGPQDLKQYLRR